jgi:hypothetical protein
LVNDSVFLEYNVLFTSSGKHEIHVLVSPTLNFNANQGLRYAISVNGMPEQLVNINKTYTMHDMEQWQAKSINSTSTLHLINKTGYYTIRVRVLEPGMVIQKIIIDTGGLKPSYLGPPESSRIQKQTSNQ